MQSPKRTTDTNDRTMRSPERTAGRTMQLLECTTDRIMRSPEHTAGRTIQLPERTTDRIMQPPERTAGRTMQLPERTTDRIMQPPERTTDRDISQAKRRRNGKKWSITRLISEIHQLVAQRGSRTKLTYLRDSLNDLLKEAIVKHEELMLLLPDCDPEFNDEWIDEISLRVNSCFAEINHYLSDRKDDPPSIPSSYMSRQDIESWREAVRASSESKESNPHHRSSSDIPHSTRQSRHSSCDEVTEAISRLYIEPSGDNVSQIQKSPPRVKERRSLSLPDLPAAQPVNLQKLSMSDAGHNYKSISNRSTNIRSQSYISRHSLEEETVPQNYQPLTDVYQSSHKQENNPQNKVKEKSTWPIWKRVTSDRQKETQFIDSGNLSDVCQKNLQSTYVKDRYEEEVPVFTSKVTEQKFTSTAAVANACHVSDEVLATRTSKVSDPNTPANPPVVNTNYNAPMKRGADTWIDRLDPDNLQTISKYEHPNVQMQMLIQQRLPTQVLPTFDGSPGNWINFITNFYDMVHSQPYLDAYQKRRYLIQQLKGEPRKAVDGYANDAEGYVWTLKKLKYMFGNQPLVAQATIQKVTTGKPIPNNSTAALTEFYYSLSCCINTLQRMNYTADLYSSDVLRQVLSRLPDGLLCKWSEYSFKLRQAEEPSLLHLERWLQDRVMATKDPYLPDRKLSKPKFNGLNSNNQKPNHPKPKRCSCCGEDHNLYHCSKYKAKPSSEKLKLVKEKKLCFNCLHSNHPVKDCPSKKTCFKDNCNKKHHTSLHESLSKTIEEMENSDSPAVCATRGTKQVYMQVVPIIISDRHGRPIKSYALLDSGSQCSIIRKSLCKKLNLPGRMKKINLGTIKDEEEILTKEVDVKISSLNEKYSTTINSVYSIDDRSFKVPGQHLPAGIYKEKKWNYIKGLNICSPNADEIGMLIGADVPSALISTEVKIGGTDLPYAAKTPFGWALIGALKRYDYRPSNSVSISHIRTESSLDDMLRQFWETESFGTKVKSEKPMSVKDQSALKLLDEETEFKDGHYVVPMIWKTPINLPYSLNTAKKRLSHLTNRFKRDDSYFKTYRGNIEDHLNKGHARKLSDEEVNKQGPKTWYVPHHGITNINKPGKVRVVFDAASKVEGRSLNNNLLTGPDLLNSLVGVLLRFRYYPIAVVGDIEAMFYQVKLKAEDAESVRFLWKDNPGNSDPPDHYQMLVHIFGATDSPCCACYALRRAALDQQDEFPEEVTQTVLKSFYMDDLLKSMKSETEAIDLVRNLIQLLDNRGFKLTKIISNSRAVLQTIPSDRKIAIVNNTVEFDDAPTITRALGVKWNLQTDCFIYTSVTKSSTNTKRGILKLTSTIFDPLGLLTPFILRAKLLLQDLWKAKLEWDEPIDDTNQKTWDRWLQDLQMISTVEVPRCMGLNDLCDVQLHMFCDASEKAFAATAHIRINNDNNISCYLLMSKSRVAPLKPLTLPRLELQGAVLAVRLKDTICQESHIKFSSIHFWTDSTLNLQYVTNEDKRFKVFVTNRVAEIRQYSNPEQWHHINGKINPADLATRGTSIEDLSPNSIWFKGPPFLYDDQSSWPVSCIETLNKNDVEIRREKLHNNVIEKKQPFIEYERFSNWRRLLRTVSWICKFVSICRKKRIPKKTATLELSVHDETFGKKTLIKLIQSESFKDEIHNLQQTTTKGISKSHLSKLDPFLDEEGILRVGGRLKHSQLPYAATHQMILPAHHHAVAILIRDIHERHHHAGKEHLLSLLRQTYWIIRCRQTVSKIIQRCVKCKRMNPRTIQPKMSNLPPDRIQSSTPPFYNTGVDYFGPMTVKILRSRIKRWGCIFTCLSTRAIHLEVAPSLSTDDFINVLERFVNRRGHPNIIRSDCGTNFKGASNELKRQLELMDHEKIEEAARRRSIQWKFNTPDAPHMGGVWERMIRSVKTTFKVILSDQIVNDYVLMTVFTEVEAFVNSRPLTYVSNDINDLEPLTPSHFLIGRANNNLTPCVVYEETTYKERWRQVQALACQFWNRWIREYLPTVTARSKWWRDTRNISIGEMVVLVDGKPTRGMWRLGRVRKVLPSDDGVVRTVEIQTIDGTFVRPVTKLAPLEHF